MKFTTLVIKGQGRGKTLGYPTFNLRIPKNFSLQPGIYASWVWLGKTKCQGALHYGPRPVFHDPAPSLEIFVLDYSSNHPITSVTFEPIKYLRPIRNFPTPVALARRISLDVAQVRAKLN